ncbi:MAG: hypothetical protein ACQESB_06225 [Elusimicrobiota bacterium]
MYRKIFVLAIGVFLLNSGLIMAHDEQEMRGNMMGGGMGPNRAGAPGRSSCAMMGMGMTGGNMMHQGMSSGGMMAGSRWDVIAQQLDLSDKQRKELAQKTRKINRNKIKLNNELRLKLFDLNYELKKEEIDEGSVDKLIDDVTGIQKSLLTIRKDNLLKFKDVFSNEQWEKFQNMKKSSRGMEDNKGIHRR